MPLKISHLYYTSIRRHLDLYERALRARSRCRVTKSQKSTKNKAVFRADPLAKLPPFLIFLSVFSSIFTFLYAKLRLVLPLYRRFSFPIFPMLRLSPYNYPTRRRKIRILAQSQKNFAIYMKLS